MPDIVRFARRSAFAGLLQPVHAANAAGVSVSECPDLQMATVIARQGRDALAGRIQAAFGVGLPAGPHWTGNRGLALVGTGPRTWLAVLEEGGPLFGDLRTALGDAAAISDQSDGYAVMHLSGPKARATFEKGLGVDLHPTAFRAGDAAVTTCSHLGVILWQLDETPSYRIALFRSLAGAFWHWLSDSAAEFGLSVESVRG
jgi:heterotetrameric sarcosine oxidase gamma subunit